MEQRVSSACCENVPKTKSYLHRYTIRNVPTHNEEGIGKEYGDCPGTVYTRYGGGELLFRCCQTTMPVISDQWDWWESNSIEEPQTPHHSYAHLLVNKTHWTQCHLLLSAIYLLDLLPILHHKVPEEVTKILKPFKTMASPKWIYIRCQRLG